MRPIRVAFVMDQVAGHVTYAQNLRPFAEADDELDVAWGEVHYHRDRGRIEWLHDRLLPFTPAHPFGVLRGVVEQRRALRFGDLDAIFTNTAVAHYDLGPVRRTPTLFDFDSTPVQLDAMDGYADTPEAGWKTEAKRRVIGRVFRHAALNQAWSTWARDSVVADYGIPADRVVVNPPGIDLAVWQPAARPLSSDRGPCRVLFVGADFHRKGGEDLLDWHRSTVHGAVHLDIVTRADVPVASAVAVHRGLAPNSPELRSLYADADVFVLPSHGECFGIATVEAMACGLPVVVTAVGGTADIVDHGGNGFIVPPRSPRELGGALDSLVADPVRRASMGARSRQIAEERFDVSTNAHRTLAHLKAIARESAAPVGRSRVPKRWSRRAEHD